MLHFVWNKNFALNTISSQKSYCYCATAADGAPLSVLLFYLMKTIKMKMMISIIMEACHI